MNDNNKKKIWKLIQHHGDQIKNNLKTSSYAPKREKSLCAYLFVNKNNFGKSYKDISDEKFCELATYIKNING